MYKLRNKINEGITVDIDKLLVSQEECWLDICSMTTTLFKKGVIEEYILSKPLLIKYLYANHKHVVGMLMRDSGELYLTSRTLKFAYNLLGLSSEDFLLVCDAFELLDMFDCYQFIYDAVGRKSGKGIYYPKLSYSPEFEYKNFKLDVDILAKCVIGNISECSIGYELRSFVCNKFGIPIESGLLCKHVVDGFEAENIDLILEFICNDNFSKLCNPLLVKCASEYVSKGANSGNGFFYSFGTQLFIEALPTMSENCEIDISSTFPYLVSKVSVFVGTKAIKSRSVSVGRVVSGYCSEYKGTPMCCINNLLGYVGEYVNAIYVSQNKLISKYNPVTFYRVLDSKKGVSLIREKMYNVTWLSYKDKPDVRYEYTPDYVRFPYNLNDLVSGLKLGSWFDFKKWLFTSVVGSNAYKDFVIANTLDLLNALVENNLCSIEKFADIFNYAKGDADCRQLTRVDVLEGFKDCDSLLVYLLY